MKFRSSLNFMFTVSEVCVLPSPSPNRLILLFTWTSPFQSFASFMCLNVKEIDSRSGSRPVFKESGQVYVALDVTMVLVDVGDGQALESLEDIYVKQFVRECKEFGA